MVPEPSKHTVRLQFEAIIQGIEQEAMAAGHALGFEHKSKQQLVTAVKREIELSTKKNRSEFEYSAQELASYQASRLACLGCIRFLLEDAQEFLFNGGPDSGLDVIDRNLALLRRCLTTAR